MATQTPNPAHVADLIGPVNELLNRNLRGQAEAFIASYTLWVCHALESGQLTPAEADEVFTSLDDYLDNRQVPVLSEAVQEIMIEGQTLHHYGEPPDSRTAPDMAYLRGLAMQVLSARPA